MFFNIFFHFINISLFHIQTGTKTCAYTISISDMLNLPYFTFGFPLKVVPFSISYKISLQNLPFSMRQTTCISSSIKSIQFTITWVQTLTY